MDHLERLAGALGRHLHVRGTERLLRALYPCSPAAKRFVRGVRARNDGLLMDLDSRSWIDWNLLFRGDYEPHMTKLWGRLAPEGGVAIDVGANIGAHTLSMARAVGARGRVLAFEPNPLVRSALARNVALNTLTQVTVYACALGSGPGTLPLRVPKAGSDDFANMGLASLVALETPHDLVDVEIRSLDDVLAEQPAERVDVIKIDVQGYEMETLRGMRGCLERHRPVIVFEYDAWAWKQADASPEDAFAALHAAGYELFKMDNRARVDPQPIVGGTPLPAFVDLLAIHAGSPDWRS